MTLSHIRLHLMSRRFHHLFLIIISLLSAPVYGLLLYFREDWATAVLFIPPLLTALRLDLRSAFIDAVIVLFVLPLLVRFFLSFSLVSSTAVFAPDELTAVSLMLAVVLVVGRLHDLSRERDRLQKSLTALEQDYAESHRQSDMTHSLKQLGLTAGTVAHDLNNLLCGIVGYPDIIRLQLAPDDPLHLPLQTIKQTGQKAAAIVQDMLVLSRRERTTLKPLDLNYTIDDLLGTPEWRHIQEKHPDCQLHLDLAPSPIIINGISIHIGKILINLMLNAYEAMPDTGGTLSLSTSVHDLHHPLPSYNHITPGRYVRLSVSDDGIGIGEEDKQRIFEPFYSCKTMGRSGSGLGMVIVWNAVHDMNGYLELTSEPGCGTRFDLYFPQIADPSEKTSAPVTPAEEKTPEQTNDIPPELPRALIVDDGEDQRKIAELMMQKLGFDVVPMSAGREAVDWLKQNDATVVLLDMVMEPMDGLATYRALAAFKPKQKIIIISGYAETEKTEEVLRQSGGRFIAKPYTFDTLKHAVNEILGK